jgi:hypothetical protein
LGRPGRLLIPSTGSRSSPICAIEERSDAEFEAEQAKVLGWS